jgi:DnaJ-class molecular chaperone
MHPDANVTQQTEIEQQIQGTLFAALSESYSILKDSKRRAAYDMQLDLTGDECVKCHGRGFTAKTKGFTARETIPCAECRATGRLLRSGCFPEMLKDKK